MARDYRLLDATVGLCPHCLARLDAKIIERDGQVFISRLCPQHGPQLDLLEEDSQYYAARDQFSKPATASRTQTECRRQCPFDCGLCPNHEQHTCIALVEITGECDLRCPVCYAGSGAGAALAPADFERMLDFALETEGGSLDILQLSGGEPTAHPELGQFLRLARQRPIHYTLLNTHGLNFLRRPELLDLLAEFPDRFEVYLQFDGLDGPAHRELRGRDLAETKLEVLAALSARKIPTTLVMSLAAGVNEDQIGPLIVHALRTPYVRGVSFQPLAYFGRVPPAQIQRTRRVTLSGVIRRIERQMKEMIRAEHLVPLPCDVDRVAIGYFRKDDHGSFTPAVTRDDARANLCQVRNTLRFTPDDFAAASAAGPSCCGGLAGKIRQLVPPSFFQARSAAARARIVSESLFRITITSFIDAYNFDLRSCQRECVHVITPDLRKIPFSAYNLYHRHQPGRA